MTRWTGDYLKQKCGSQIVEVQANRNSDANYEINQTKLKKEMTFVRPLCKDFTKRLGV